MIRAARCPCSRNRFRAHRVGDVPGYESRRVSSVRPRRRCAAPRGRARAQPPRLISLAAVLARAIDADQRAGRRAGDIAQEAYGLARVYERAGAYDNAEAALLRTIEFAKRVGAEPEVHGEALRRLAWLRRRGGGPRSRRGLERTSGVAALRCGVAPRGEGSARDLPRASLERSAVGQAARD